MSAPTPAPPVDPRDDRFHTPDPGRERWRESFYFNVYDFGLGIGLYSSVGYRPAKQSYGSMHVVWGLGRSALGASEYGRYDAHTDHLPVAGLTYAPRAALGAWDIAFDGRLNDAGADVSGDADAMAPVGTAPTATVDVSYNLTFTPDQPAYLYKENPEWDGLFDGHLDEVGRVTGTLTIDGTTYPFDGRGSKDHSWGVRDWARPKGWRWADFLFDDGGPQASLWRATFDGTRWLQDGAIYADDTAFPLDTFHESATFAPRARADRPSTWTFDFTAGPHRFTGKAEILQVTPLLFKIRDTDGTPAQMWNDRTVFRCELSDGRTGIGSAEFQFRAPPSGPAPHPLLSP